MKQKCPVCLGTGTMSQSFYNRSGCTPSTAPLYVGCRSCHSEGIVSSCDCEHVISKEDQDRFYAKTLNSNILNPEQSGS